MATLTIKNPERISGIIFDDWVIGYFGRNLSFGDNYSWEIRHRAKVNPIGGIGSIAVMRDLSLLDNEVMIQYEYESEIGRKCSGRVYVEAEYLKDPDNLVGIVKDRILDKFTM